ncbi:roquin-2-like [Frankliniella occidentalis]|uniref:Roquin-2-like n=1 Tax=Frankliniella occidentalis TaxID=133901 RepID=A0A9C6X7Z2_FRAOC|nr:roquin-2-like [Frankliniella occidentalis]
MALLCDVCLDQFDLDIHRPKSSPCGHTICCECVHNPAFGLKCPTCRKVLSTDPKSLPDNVLAIRLIGADGAPPPRIAAPEREEAKMLQLQRGVDAGRKVVQVLRQVSLQRHLDSSVAQLRQMEDALEKMQKQATAGAGNSSAAEEGARDTVRHLQHLRQVAQLEDSLRLLTTNRCSIVAEEDEATWRTTVHLGPLDDQLEMVSTQVYFALRCCQAVLTPAMSVTRGDALAPAARWAGQPAKLPCEAGGPPRADGGRGSASVSMDSSLGTVAPLWQLRALMSLVK